MILDHINDIVAICSGHGVETAIISPGSRSAPLTLAFARHPDIKTFVIPDERSAAFIGMGMAQNQKKPVVLVCTSGSAAYNYAPAIAEAFFQEIPLLVLTADRPPEWVDQYDGQTIRQSGIYGKHVKASFNFPDNPSHPDIAWHGNRLVNETLMTCMNQPLGPVHINVPLREPFYPEKDEHTFFRKVRTITSSEGVKQVRANDWAELSTIWNDSKRRLIIAGQQDASPALKSAVDEFSKTSHTPVISDIISNFHGIENAIVHQDAFLSASLDSHNEVLKPDLLITCGKSNISKNLKRFIRKYKPQHHWHIQSHERYQDTFQSLSQIIQCHAKDFFKQAKGELPSDSSTDYLQVWKDRDQQVARLNSSFLSEQEFGEFTAAQEVLKQLPDEAELHLSNSMAVRYANYIGIKEKPNVSVKCNRGTSGIDGCNSTAVGAAIDSQKQTVLITGDVAFFYDRNAFWHQYHMPNLRIVVLNNQGGGIFRLIKGPSDQPELREYFETDQRLSAEHLAREFGFNYNQVTDLTSLRNDLVQFFQDGETPKILEIQSSSEQNAAIFKAYQSAIAAGL